MPAVHVCWREWNNQYVSKLLWGHFTFTAFIVWTLWSTAIWFLFSLHLRNWKCDLHDLELTSALWSFNFPLEFEISWCSVARAGVSFNQPSNSIEMQSARSGAWQWVKASVRLLAAEHWNTKSLLWIQNHTSDTQGFSPEFPPSLSPPTTGLNLASDGDHLRSLVNLSWRSLHSLHRVNGDDGGCKGWMCLSSSTYSHAVQWYATWLCDTLLRVRIAQTDVLKGWSVWICAHMLKCMCLLTYIHMDVCAHRHSRD